MYVLVIKQLAIMILLALCGFGVTKAFAFGQKEQQFVSKILIYFINPCLLVSRFNMDFDAEKLRNLGIVFVIALVVHVAMILIAELSYRRAGAEDFSIDKLSVVFTNCAFIGIPLIDGVFPGSNGIFYLLAFIVLFNIFLWSYGYRSVCGKINFLQIIKNPNIIALLAGMLLFCAPLRLPELIASPLRMIASMNTAMAMFLLGMLFANFHGYNRSYIKKTAKLCMLRFVITGVVTLAIVYAAFRIFSGIQDIRLMCYVVYIAALCPVGMSVSSFAVLFNKDESYSGLLVLVTSALSVVALPLAVALAERLF